MPSLVQAEAFAWVGFLALRLARAERQVTAMDISAGTVALLARIAPRLSMHLDVVAGDACAAPLASGSADILLALHLLEHLPEAAGDAVLAEMLRLARQRAVVAVPYEATPNPTWGHVRCFDHAALQSLGARTGRPFRVTDHHGGWLVVEP